MKLFLQIFLLIILQISTTFSQCGRFSYSSGVIFNGDYIKRGEFPFLVALIRSIDQKFFCGANLITQKHALTASHCIHEKSATKPLQAEDIIALLGKYNLNIPYEKGLLPMDIAEIIVHEDWKPYVKRYDADIAVLVFERMVQLTEYIKIVCIPSSWQTYNLQEGEVVGWGKSETTTALTPEERPKKIKIKKPPTNENCFLTEPALVATSSNRTFCAGGESSGPCNGDSGGGFYVQNNSAWYLQGIISASLFDDQGSCDVSKYAVYTNVAFYANWIWEKVNGVKPLELQCDFDISDNLKTKPYSCTADVTILEDNFFTKSANGKHFNGKTNNDVELLSFNDDFDNAKEVYYIPSGISDVFPNLKTLYIQECKLTRLSRKNFIRMDKLSVVSLSGNNIEHIDEESFYEVPRLYSLRLNSNKLKTIPPNLLINAPRLQHFIFNDNLIEEIDCNVFFRNNLNLRTVDLEDNSLRKIQFNLSTFPNLSKVILNQNICVKATFDQKSPETKQQLQELIDRNC